MKKYGGPGTKKQACKKRNISFDNKKKKHWKEFPLAILVVGYWIEHQCCNYCSFCSYIFFIFSFLFVTFFSVVITTEGTLY